LTLQQELRFLNNRWSFKWARKIINNAAAVTTLSPHMLEGLQKKGFDNVQLLPLGIEGYFLNNRHVILNEAARNEESPVNFRGDPSLTLRMTNKWNAGLRNGQLKLLSVCNLLPVKNLSAVFEAIHRMEDKDRLKYDIYGTGPMEAEWKSEVKALGLEQIIQFKGRIENKDLPGIMPAYDLFMQPSLKETLGLSYFEALACGLPVILTRNTGAYEMIKEKDVYYLVDPNDTNSITGCLQDILNDLETLSNKAILAPDVAKIASWDGFVDYFHETYEEVVRHTPNP
jgi:glycosyltransferase involved in cell wall biosynthesis